MLWLEIAGPIATYVFGGMYAYRRRYVKLFTEYKRWQANDPEKTEKWLGDYDWYRKSRKNVDFHRYVWSFQDHTPAGALAPLWPLYLPAKIVKNFLRPEVKVPDYEKIRGLENKIKKETVCDGACTGTCVC